MNAIKTLIYIFIAGALGGFVTGVLVWAFGKAGITPATGFNMVPEFTPRWIGGRTFASGIWGIIFLIPIFQNRAIIKGAVLGLLPWLSSIFFILPYKMDKGFFGLDLGYGTPVWTLVFGVLWGVIGTLFLAKFRPQLKLR